MPVPSLNVNTIEHLDGSGNITVPYGTYFVANTLGSYRCPGEVIQIQVQSTMPTSHLSTTTTNETDVPLLGNITPTSNTSNILVEIFSTMCDCDTSPIWVKLSRRIDGNAWVELTPFTANAELPWYYGLAYTAMGWGPMNWYYLDSPNTTGLVEYKMTYRLNSGTTISYFCHQYEEYGFILEEIAA